jgi:hypothetical protein
MLLRQTMTERSNKILTAVARAVWQQKDFQNESIVSADNAASFIQDNTKR